MTEDLKTNNFLDVYRDNHLLIYKFIYIRIGYSRELAEDLTQEVFYKALRNFNNYNPTRSNIRTWLFTITRNVMIDYFRKNRFKTLDIEDISEAESTDEKKILTFFILSKLKELKDIEREVIIYKYINQLNDEEIAKIINKRSGATRVLIHRSLTKLKDIVNK